MKQMMEEEPEKEDEYLQWFVDLQVQMHKLRIPKMSKHRDKMNGKIAHTELSATLRYDLHNRVEAMPRHNCVLHGVEGQDRKEGIAPLRIGNRRVSGLHGVEDDFKWHAHELVEWHQNVNVQNHRHNQLQKR